MSDERKARILELLVQIENMGLETGYISEIAKALSLSKAWIYELLKLAENYGYVKIWDAYKVSSGGWVRRISITEKGRLCMDQWVQVKETCSKPYIEFVPPIWISRRGERVRRREKYFPTLKEIRRLLGLGRVEGTYYKLARYVYDRFGICPLCLRQQQNT